ncbi:sigma-70 family RNA polymerase sigma factor [Thalassobacillus sp. C254]|uniref:sigma-70 family RNA polymerase sigma factor n=1 Tax=Thalassobacillus sp. C254 TaxID=1225341 RepID=UPI0006D0C3A1|nr:sigma-70 family RNA polymerase sigma factor [Thalassobacillus sp. C254]
MTMNMDKLREEIDEVIKDYQWMIHEIERLQKILYSSKSAPASLVSQYGLEASMPKAQGTNYHAEEYQEMIDARRMKRLERMKGKVEAIDKDASALPSEKQQAVMDLLMIGFTYRGIGKALGMTISTVSRIKEEILEHLVQMSHIKDFLRK